MIAVIAAVNTLVHSSASLPGTCRTAGVRESGVLLKNDSQIIQYCVADLKH